jgi:hypothetical protein
MRGLGSHFPLDKDGHLIVFFNLTIEDSNTGSNTIPETA